MININDIADGTQMITVLNVYLTTFYHKNVLETSIVCDQELPRLVLLINIQPLGNTLYKCCFFSCLSQKCILFRTYSLFIKF